MRKFLGECRDHLARRRGGECRPQEGCQRNQGAPSVKSPSQTVGELSMRPIDSRDTRGAIAPKDWRDLSVPKTQGRCRRTAEQRDELAAVRPRVQSITSSAVASKVGGTVRASILAVWALMTSSN